MNRIVKIAAAVVATIIIGVAAISQSSAHPAWPSAKSAHIRFDLTFRSDDNRRGTELLEQAEGW
jgi:hypothetical protein